MYPKPWHMEMLVLRNPGANVHSVYGIPGKASPRRGENISVQYPTFQEGVSQAAKGSFTKGGIKHKENWRVLVETPVTVPRNHMTCPGMEPATMQGPYQTGTSDTNNCFFYSTLLQENQQHWTLVTRRFQLLNPHPYKVLRSANIIFVSTYEQYKSTWFCELSYWLHKVHTKLIHMKRGWGGDYNFSRKLKKFSSRPQWN
jgi:hypothetical protein